MATFRARLFEARSFMRDLIGLNLFRLPAITHDKIAVAFVGESVGAAKLHSLLWTLDVAFLRRRI